MPRLSQLTRTSILLAVCFLLDKVLAFSKSLIFNKVVGLDGMGIFGASNNIPDYLSALLSGGALGMALIPVLKEYLDSKGRKEAWKLFSRVVNLSFLITAGFSILIIFFSDPLVRYIIAPHFTPEKQVITASLMRIDLGAIIIFSISGLAMAGLQANKHFLLPALAPIFYNLGQIFGVTILTPSIGLRLGAIRLPAFGFGLYGMVYGVILGACLHLLIQVPGLIKFGFRWQPIIGFKNPDLLRVVILLWPRVLTMACIQAYYVARDNLGSQFQAIGVGALNLGWTIEQVPETIIGTTIAIALLPTLAEFINSNHPGLFKETVNRALKVILALCLPVASIVSLGINPLIQTFFKFDPNQTRLVTLCAWAFLVGLLGDAWLETAVRSFYANQNTRTPLVASAIQVISFITLGYIFSRLIGLPGIPLAASITFSLQAFSLLYIMNRKYPGLWFMGSTLFRSIIAAVIGGGICFSLIHFFPFATDINALIGMAVGGGVAFVFIIPEMRLLMRL